MNGLDGYCLYKDGQLVPPPDPQIPTAVGSGGPAGVPTPTGAQGSSGVNGNTAVDANGQCCPPASPISINITNSQDTNTNSKNMNAARSAPPQKRIIVPQQQVATPPPLKVITIVKKEKEIVGKPVFIRRDRIIHVPVPVEKTVIQKVEVPVVKEVVKEVKTERIVNAPVTGCEGKTFNYPEWL